MALGDLVIVYDEDVSGARIRMKSDQNKIVCNHIICRKYELKWFVDIVVVSDRNRFMYYLCPIYFNLIDLP